MKPKSRPKFKKFVPVSERVDPNPRAYALWLLGRRDYSRHQLEQKLRARGNRPEVIAALLQTLTDEGLFREQAFTKARVRAFIHKGLGAKVIRARLRFEKIPAVAGDVDQGFADLGVDEAHQVRELVRKRLKSARRVGRAERNSSEFKQKIVKALMLKGHDATKVRRELELQLKEESLDGQDEREGDREDDE